MAELTHIFREQAEAVQTKIAFCSFWDEAVRYAVEVTAFRGGRTIAHHDLPGETLQTLKHAASSEGIAIIDPPYRNHLEAIHTAVSPAWWAIAETGTLVLDSTSEDGRIVTMLAEVHVAILPEHRIHRQALELQKVLTTRQRKGPCYLAFISGASRTADIERVLSIGVHGPQELHVVIVQEDAP